jgi:tRNA(Ile)-lysidine synthetase-like protein
MIKVIKQILPKDRQYHLAVSMGIDSVAAMFWLKSKGYKVTPLHFNHNLRAQNGTMQERFWDMCRDLNIEGKSESAPSPMPHMIPRSTVGLRSESDCRNARLEFFKKHAPGGYIITAHHLNDWVESYLLKCLRGQPNHRPFELESAFPEFNILHPFLLSKKSDLRQYLERNGWMKYVVQDETNSFVKGSRRNWVRNAIIPQMTQQRLSLEKYAKRRIGKMLEANKEWIK